MRYLFLLALIMPCIASAQGWRIQASGGMVTTNNLTRKSVFYANRNHQLATAEFSTIDAIGGLSLLRSDSAIEYGISVQVLPIHFKDYSPMHETYLGRPAIPVTAVINYSHYRSRSNAYIGGAAGIVYAAGKVTDNFSALDYTSDLAVYYNSGLGYTFGVQAGYRRNLKRTDFGFQLQASYMYLPLKHGTDPDPIGFNLIYFPVQLYIGYRL